MSVDCHTDIRFKGTAEEVLKQLKCIEEYVLHGDRKEVYLDSIRINTKNEFYGLNTCAIEFVSSEADAVRRYVEEADGQIYLKARGPWGRYCSPSEICLFEKLAEAAPRGCFDGKINWCCNTEIDRRSVRGQLYKRGILKLTIDEPFNDHAVNLYDPIRKQYIDDFELPKDCKLGKYIKSIKASKMSYDMKLNKAIAAVKSCLPYETYLELVDLEPKTYSEKNYDAMLHNIDQFGGYPGFIEFGGRPDYSEKQYKDLLSKVMSLKYCGKE